MFSCSTLVRRNVLLDSASVDVPPTLTVAWCCGIGD